MDTSLPQWAEMGMHLLQVGGGRAVPVWLEAVVGLLVATGLVGMVGPWLVQRLRAGQYAETEAVLRQKFASLDEVNGVGRKLSSLEMLYVQHTDRLDAVEDRTLKLETITEARWERITNQMQETANTLGRVMEQVRQVSDAQIRITTLIEERKGDR